jgi:hypothetical protein
VRLQAHRESARKLVGVLSIIGKLTHAQSSGSRSLSGCPSFGPESSSNFPKADFEPTVGECWQKREQSFLISDYGRVPR